MCIITCTVCLVTLCTVCEHPKGIHSSSYGLCSVLPTMIIGITIAYVRTYMEHSWMHARQSVNIFTIICGFAVCGWYVNSAVSAHTDASTTLLCQLRNDAGALHPLRASSTKHCKYLQMSGWLELFNKSAGTGSPGTEVARCSTHAKKFFSAHLVFMAVLVGITPFAAKKYLFLH